MIAPKLPNLSATASLLHNNLAASSGGWLACVHNSVNVGGGKVVLVNHGTGASKIGPDVAQATSIRYIELLGGPVLCISSTNGTQIYAEDASALLFFAPLNDSSTDAERLKYHQGSCAVSDRQHIVVGTSKGALLVVNAVPDKFMALADSAPSSATGEVSDVCFVAAANAVVSAHNNGDLRFWTPSPSGPYTNSAVRACTGQAPVRVAALGPRLLVAHGPGTICLYDAASHELQVELSAHARWITAVATREDTGLVATVAEDTILNVWQVDPSSGRVSLRHSCIVTQKLLTGVALAGAGAVVTTYDSDELFHVAF